MKTKLIIASVSLLCLLIAVPLAWMSYKNTQTEALLSIANEQLMQAELEIGKAHTRLGNAEKQLELLSKNLRAMLNRNQELMTSYAELEAELKISQSIVTETTPEVSTTEIVETKDPKFEKGNLYQALNKHQLANLLKIPFRWGDHRLKFKGVLVPSPPSLSLKVTGSYDLTLKLSVKLIKTISQSGAVNHYVEIFEIDEKGKNLNKLQINKFEVTTQDKRSRQWLVPTFHLAMGVGASIEPMSGLIKPVASLSLSTLGYGLTENDLSWRFLSANVDLFSNGVGLSVTPLSYNVAGSIPILSNLWVSPLSFGMGLFVTDQTKGLELRATPYLSMKIEVVL